MTAPPGTGRRGNSPLAGGPHGPDALQPLLATVLDALRTGAQARGGPLPAGGPEAVTARVTAALGEVLPDHGHGDHEALRTLVHTLTAGAADPADPLCAAHLHCPPLAVAAAADLAASALNASLDSWDQAPAASTLEALLTRTLAAEFHNTPHPDAVLTTGGTEANHLALLLARERHGPHLTVLHGANAHHSIPRAAWLLGLPPARSLPTPTGTLTPATLAEALATTTGPVLVTATAGTTDAGLIDPLDALADLCDHHGADLHIDASYGGLLHLSPRHRPKLAGLHRARSITIDLHKLGWQPIAAGLLTVPDTTLLAPSPTRPTTSTPPTTPKPASPTSSAAPCAPPAAQTPSKSPPPCAPSAETDSPTSSTAPAPAPTSSPDSSKHTPPSNSTRRPPSAPSCSGPPTPTTPHWPPCAAPSSRAAPPYWAGPPPTAAYGSRPPCSTPTPRRGTWTPS